MTCTIEIPEVLSASERETLARILADEAYAREEWERIQTLPPGEERHEAEEGLMAWRASGAMTLYAWVSGNEIEFAKDKLTEANSIRAAVRTRREAAYQAARETR